MKINPEEPCPCGSHARYADCHGHPDRHVVPDVSTTVPLRVIPEPDPETRSVFRKVGDGTILFQGRLSSTAYVCGKCGEPLVVGMPLEELVNLVLGCANCGAFNETQTGE
jgi:DNA-directed RNA polymerase subunit RPC12/RpoP